MQSDLDGIGSNERQPGQGLIDPRGAWAGAAVGVLVGALLILGPILAMELADSILLIRWMPFPSSVAWLAAGAAGAVSCSRSRYRHITTAGLAGSSVAVILLINYLGGLWLMEAEITPRMWVSLGRQVVSDLTRMAGLGALGSIVVQLGQSRLQARRRLREQERSRLRIVFQVPPQRETRSE